MHAMAGRATAGAEEDRAMSECPVCGYHDKGKGKPRSIDQHRRFYGLVKKAFGQWPEKSDFQPEDEEHLRQWLICAAGPQWRE